MQTTLLIMAAGIGSRFGGGIKQLEPVDDSGHIIMDYSIHDALAAGFNKVVFIIRKDIEKEFREVIGDRIEAVCAQHDVTVDYAFQDLQDIPGELPEGRTKPWGTGQAVLAAKDVLTTPFIVINADDYYGKQAFRDQYRFLTETEDESSRYHYSMSGYHLANTLTENGHVSRGVCTTDARGYLTDIVERTRIEWKDGVPAYTLDEGVTWTSLPAETPVSMNMWGFGRSFLAETEARFADFLNRGLAENPMKCEYYIPSVVHELLAAGRADVRVMTTPDKWYGVTYKEDKPMVQKAIADMKARGLYPAEF